MRMLRKKLYEYFLLKKYSKRVNAVYNNNKTILDILSEKYDLEKVDVDCVDEIFVEHALIANIDALKSDIEIYKIISNQKSQVLYEYAHNKEDFIDENFIIAIDNNSDFFVTNFDVLQNYLWILKGVSDFDYSNKTVDFYMYLDTLHYFYKNKYHKVFK